MARRFESRIAVRSYELDAYRHVNHAVYLNYFETARFAALDEGGVDLREVEGRGESIHVVRIEVDYRAEARLGDILHIRTAVEEFRRSSMVIVQEARRERDGGTVAEARVVAVWVGEEGRPIPIPDDVRRGLEG